MAKLNQRVWTNSSLTEKTKLRVYQACVMSTLLYGSESWTPYTRHGRRLNTFHLRCLRRILQIKWQVRVPNTEVLERASMLSMQTTLSERRLRWIGHVRRMDEGRIPKDLLYGELVQGTRPTGRPKLRYRDVTKRDFLQCGVAIDSWEQQASDRSAWRRVVKEGIRSAEDKRLRTNTEKRKRQKGQQQQPQQQPPYLCSKCGRDCHSRVGLQSF